ncbi:MAG: flagellar export chaperone FliS [Armatimonadota bacterium]|nr:flagellar export chaperone FliS [bacterium]MDW8320007.1 flagellar export chaperone FliS [Armatimonadota bacterium]
MALTSPYDVYQRTQVDTASPARLVVMLYDGAIRFLRQGQAAMQQGDREKQNHYLVRAQRIIAELASSLNMEEGGEIAVNLMALYQFMHEQLVLANLQDDVDKVQKVRQMLESLREAWTQVEIAARESITLTQATGAETPHAA